MEFKGFSLSLCELNGKGKLNRLRMKNAYIVIICLLCSLAFEYPYFCRPYLEKELHASALYYELQQYSFYKKIIIVNQEFHVLELRSDILRC